MTLTDLVSPEELRKVIFRTSDEPSKTAMQHLIDYGLPLAPMSKVVKEVIRETDEDHRGVFGNVMTVLEYINEVITKKYGGVPIDVVESLRIDKLDDSSQS